MSSACTSASGCPVISGLSGSTLLPLVTPGPVADGDADHGLDLDSTSSSTSRAITGTADPAPVERLDAGNEAVTSSPWLGVRLADAVGPVTAGTHRDTATARTVETDHGSAVLLPCPAGGTR